MPASSLRQGSRFWAQSGSIPTRYWRAAQNGRVVSCVARASTGANDDRISEELWLPRSAPTACEMDGRVDWRGPAPCLSLQRGNGSSERFLERGLDRS